MTDIPKGFNSTEEYFEWLSTQKQSGRRFPLTRFDFAKTRQGRGTTSGPLQTYGRGEEDLYDEAYGPSRKSRKGGFYGGGSFDEGLIARRNSRDAAEHAERQASMPKPKKPRKKKPKPSS